MTAKPEQDDMDFPDPWDYPALNSSLPMTNRVPEEELEEKRRELFEKGSDFLITQREDIVGIDNVLVEIDYLIHWLANAPAYQEYSARLEPGVIFEGEPGTGKTLVSRYIASASGALFINVRDWPHSGSLFTDSDISALFEMARKTYAKDHRPIVLFWDEFENGAVERSSATPAQAATVSQLTAELDGIHGKNEGILLIGCTNYIYGIDAALRRSGRMGIQIEFHAPDRSGKKLLLAHYIKRYQTNGEIDVDTLSYFFDGDNTAADIEEACMEAWRHAIYRTIENKGGKPSLSQEDLVTVCLQRLVGPPATFVNMPLEDRSRVAVHEVGHAIMALVYDVPLRLITVQPGKKSLGRTITANVRDHIGSIDEMVSDMRVIVGSITAEKVAGLPASTGAIGDVTDINKLAVKVIDYLYAGRNTGLFSMIAIAESRRDSSVTPTPNISSSSVKYSDSDIRALLRNVEKDGLTTMEKIGKDRLLDISAHVNNVVTMTGIEFEDLFRGRLGNPKKYRA